MRRSSGPETKRSITPPSPTQQVAIWRSCVDEASARVLDLLAAGAPANGSAEVLRLLRRLSLELRGVEVSMGRVEVRSA